MERGISQGNSMDSSQGFNLDFLIQGQVCLPEYQVARTSSSYLLVANVL